MTPSTFNPLTSRVAEREHAVDTLTAQMTEYSEGLKWYDSVDPKVAYTHSQEADEEVARLDAHTAILATELGDLQTEIQRLRPLAAFGWLPFASKARSNAASELDHRRVEAKQLVKQLRDMRAKFDQAKDDAAEAQSTWSRYSETDRDRLARQLSEVDKELRDQSVELDRMRVRAERLDAELEVPLAEYKDIQSRIGRLTTDRGYAERYIRELNQASDSRERAMVHHECEQRFRTGKPQDVIRRIDRERPPLERSAEKLEHRLREISRRGSLDVRGLIVDGSNMCYEGSKLIGLFAIRALCAELTSDRQLTVVFDASITRKLGVPSDERLRAQLPDVNVHLMASRSGADETILDLAEDPNTYVISNDRFADFPEKSAVLEGRLITHEIVNGRVLVRDLGVDARFGPSS